MNENDYIKQMRWWFDEYMASPQVPHYLELFPELNSRLSKFAAGIFQWNLRGQIDINNPDDVSRVRIILKVLDQTPAFDFFDNTFNEVDPDTVCEILGLSALNPREEKKIPLEYSVTAITSYEDAKKYGRYEMVSWCIVISEESFKEYTANGNRFYFLANEEWWEVESIPGKDFPRDNYGCSLVAVEMTPDNKVASVTSRWNNCAGDTGDFFSAEELKDILGENFKKLLI